jgi:outer membrane protein TolC
MREDTRGAIVEERIVPAAVLLALPLLAAGQQTPAPPAAPATPSTQLPSARITLDEAIRLSLLHNHALQAMRSTIQQSQAEEITANLRPNPAVGIDTQYLSPATGAGTGISAVD